MSDPSLPANLREFECQHCHGKIRIPKDLPPTTGPCPHCGGPITSPGPEAAPSSYLPAVPLGYQTQPAPTVSPLQSAPLPAPPSSSAVPSYAQPQPQPQSRSRPAPAEPLPPANQPAPSPEPAPVISPAAAEPLPQRRAVPKPAEAPPQKSVAPLIILALLLLAFVAAAAFVVMKEMKAKQGGTSTTSPSPNPSVAENQYLRIGWQKEAYSVLEKFLAANTAEAKIPYILNGEVLKPQIDSFYGGSIIHDQDTPADAFSVHELAESDHKRGIFMLVYDQPPQFDMKEFFRPLATLEVQYGLNEADLLLSTVARVGNFASEPLRVNAFFKRTPQGLKLDWETFAQTKYHTFQTMVELPEPGQSGIFRVLISQDVPDAGKDPGPGIKTYRLTDPASPETAARVNVNADSPLGKTLSEINWIGQQSRPVYRTATVELKWSGGDQPQLQISRFICWEFLHLGGEETKN